MWFGLKKLWCIKHSVLAISFPNTFTHNQAEQTEKGVICVQILLVALLFYVHGKHLRSCRDGQLT